MGAYDCDCINNLEYDRRERKAQLSHEGTTSDTISHHAAIEAVFKEGHGTIKERLERLPTIQPEPHCDEWCTGCKEYDQEHHSCPRWNKVIRQTLKDIEPSIPLSWINEHIEWLKSLDNEFANLAAAHISVMVKKWRREQHEND